MCVLPNLCSLLGVGKTKERGGKSTNNHYDRSCITAIYKVLLQKKLIIQEEDTNDHKSIQNYSTFWLYIRSDQIHNYVVKSYNHHECNVHIQR